MEIYKDLYFFLFNKITDVIQEMEQEEESETAEHYLAVLRKIQADAEEKFLDA